ncbi:hypothetical protein P168DRAFT_316522 [Aspergillus campestris IBT 28561]|uniref:Myb-like domain-containing protein n=1 Tax=Aspergillus campestris (strain IBT 28561) TaxID=1392248 RepID=A0A2I1D9G8_ASPC2|nr:uncharacterized protein P168DRAFT_316522 [Aspergillus campestris IBT 28561]PKY06523.1 hypothetical protein P168DRAFT_316522 [Aspergillus campestris IBT 28561]
MFHQTPGDYTGPMPYAQNPSHPGEGMENYYESVPSQWPGVEGTPYGDVGHPYSGAAAFPSSHILTPISLPDASYPQPRASPVLSHHSQEYAYHVAESVPPHGLGITAPFPSEFPRTVTADLHHTLEGSVYFGETSLSPEPSRAKRTRRSPQPILPSRETPVNILPHPEGLQRLEHERQLGPTEPHLHRPRAPGRGRRDPQAEEEDTFVERLREQNLAWKVIREKFRERFHKDASEARLQMRMLRRRKDRLARWDENDIQLLIRAREYWEREKYNFISQKMREFGSRRVYTPQQCEAQLRELDAQQQLPQRIPPQRATDPQHARRRAILKASRASSSIPVTTTVPMTKV